MITERNYYNIIVKYSKQINPQKKNYILPHFITIVLTFTSILNLLELLFSNKLYGWQTFLLYDV